MITLKWILNRVESCRLVTQDRDKCRALVNRGMKFRVPQMWGIHELWAKHFPYLYPSTQILGIISTLYAYEDGTDTEFRNVGTKSSDAGRLPKKNTIRHSTHGESLKSRLIHELAEQLLYSQWFLLNWVSCLLHFGYILRTRICHARGKVTNETRTITVQTEKWTWKRIVYILSQTVSHRSRLIDALC